MDESFGFIIKWFLYCFEFFVHNHNIQDGNILKRAISLRSSAYGSIAGRFRRAPQLILGIQHSNVCQPLIIGAENQDFFGAAPKYHRQALAAMLTSQYLPRWIDK